MAENITDMLVDASIARSLLLIRVGNGLSRDVAKIYDDMIKDIEKSLRGSDPIGIKNMNKIIKELKDRFIVDLPIYVPLQDLAVDEAKYIAKTVNTLASVEVFNRVVPESSLMRIVNTELVHGSTIGNWFKSIDQSMQEDLSRAVKMGVSIGETNPQIAKRVQDSLNVNKRHAETITRTAVNTVTNSARQKVFEANEDVISKYQYISTLDSRTSDFCKAYSMKTWTVDKKPIGHNLPYRVPPSQTHWNCRSVIVPVIKSFREIGIDIDDIPKGTQASMDGQISADLSFNDWLKTKNKKFIDDLLGPSRAELFQDGKITMSDLITQQGRSLTVKELNSKLD